MDCLHFQLKSLVFTGALLRFHQAGKILLGATILCLDALLVFEFFVIYLWLFQEVKVRLLHPEYTVDGLADQIVFSARDLNISVEVLENG